MKWIIEENWMQEQWSRKIRENRCVCATVVPLSIAYRRDRHLSELMFINYAWNENLSSILFYDMISHKKKARFRVSDYLPSVNCKKWWRRMKNSLPSFAGWFQYHYTSNSCHNKSFQKWGKRKHTRDNLTNFFSTF